MFPYRTADVTNAVCLLPTGTVPVLGRKLTGPGLPLSVTLTGVGGSVDLTSASIKRNLNIL